MIKLPPTQLAQYQASRLREHQAMLHLGIATAEYEGHRQRLLAQAAKDRAAQDAAVRAGLVALGLDLDDKKTHYSVDPEGTVQQLVDGEHFDLRRLG